MPVSSYSRAQSRSFGQCFGVRGRSSYLCSQMENSTWLLRRTPSGGVLSRGLSPADSALGSISKSTLTLKPRQNQNRYDTYSDRLFYVMQIQCEWNFPFVNKG